MGLKRPAVACLLLLALALLAWAALAGSERSSVARAQSDDARYALANGCYALRSRSAGRFVAKSAGGGYSATAGGAGEAEPFRMQATDLGRYLFYGKAGDFLAVGLQDRVETAATPSPAADWRVEGPAGALRISLPSVGKALAVSDSGELVMVSDAGAAADRALFTFEAAQGCAVYPEAEVNATGEPSKGATPYGDTSGFIDAHLHAMAFEFLGGSVRCGRPWHPYGIPFAMVDCPDHGPGGAGAALENTISYGNPVGTHDTVGWPTFKDWPAYRSLTHEQVYYKGLERAWRGGLRLYVNLLVDNAVLCELYPLKRNSCNEMDGVRLQLKRINELQDYIDAQSGGPGKGWFRIVRTPFEARRIINQGKLAVVLGIENSKLFDCGEYNDVPECTPESIDRDLDAMFKGGVRSMELVNKFDNALAGVAGDAGTTGPVVNAGNKYETGNFWAIERCQGEGSDNAQPGANNDALLGGIQLFLPPGAAPVYPEPPHCNTRGLTKLGEHLIRRMMRKGMIFDPDHMSDLARNQALDLTESKDYSGVISSHSWSSLEDEPRILRSGGVVTPYAGSSTSFVEKWRRLKPQRSSKHYFGLSYGADMNGFGGQGAPRGTGVPNPVKYPFKSFDGAVTLDRQRWGERVWDVNADGVAHYGLYVDWVEDLRMLAGDEIVNDMARGAEAYLQMWERANGVPQRRCRSVHEGFTSKELGRVRLNAKPEQVLRSTNQPSSRPGRTYRWCVGDKKERKGEIVAVFTPAERVGLVASTAPRHRSRGIGRGSRASRLRGRARSIGSGLYVRGGSGGTRIVYGVSKGRVRFVALATASVGKNKAELLKYLKLARLR